MDKKKESRKVLTSIEIDILSQLIYLCRELYGLELMNRINDARRKYDMTETQYGSFYPALQRLEKEGLIKSQWGDETDVSSSGARRKYYTVTPEGRKTYRVNDEYRVFLGNSQLQGVKA